MKSHFLSGILFLFIFILGCSSCGVTNAPADVDLPSNFFSIGNIIAVALALYELIVRFIPTVDNISILHKLISWLQALSTFFNKSK